MKFEYETFITCMRMKVCVCLSSGTLYQVQQYNLMLSKQTYLVSTSAQCFRTPSSNYKKFDGHETWPKYLVTFLKCENRKSISVVAGLPFVCEICSSPPYFRTEIDCGYMYVSLSVLYKCCTLSFVVLVMCSLQGPRHEK